MRDRLVPFLLLLLLASCQAGGGEGDASTIADDGGDAEAAVDGDGANAEADVEVEPVGGPVTLIGVGVNLSTERVCDFDGDGIGDNALADLGPLLADLVLVALNSFVGVTPDDADPRLLHIPWVDDLATPSDDSAVIIPFNGVDTDEPPDPSDNHSGEEPFYVEGEALDACGEPRYFFPEFSLVDGEIEAHAGAFPIKREINLTLRGASLFGSLEPYGASAEVSVCGYALVNELGGVEGLPQSGALTYLEMLLAGGVPYGLSIPGVMPDVDLDGDGLERFEVDDEGHVESCLDGDSTVITGRDCYLDERMADGFSMTAILAATSAVFAGREPGWEDLVEGECEDGPPEVSVFDPR